MTKSKLCIVFFFLFSGAESAQGRQLSRRARLALSSLLVFGGSKTENLENVAEFGIHNCINARRRYG
jgi:hypothetical protein